jgi:hypothetical protein
VAPLFSLLFWNVQRELPNSDERSAVYFWGVLEQDASTIST